MLLVDKNTCIIEFKPPAPTCMLWYVVSMCLCLFLHISHIFEHECIRASTKLNCCVFTVDHLATFDTSSVCVNKDYA